MLEKILAQFAAQLALFLLEYLEKRIEKGKVAIDSVADYDRLQRAGDRIAEWVRTKNNTGSGEQSNQSGS